MRFRMKLGGRTHVRGNEIWWSDRAAKITDQAVKEYIVDTLATTEILPSKSSIIEAIRGDEEIKKQINRSFRKDVKRDMEDYELYAGIRLALAYHSEPTHYKVPGVAELLNTRQVHYGDIYDTFYNPDGMNTVDAP